MMAPSNRKPFYFINKSAVSSSLSKSQPDEKSAIQRHVQLGRKRHRPSRKQSRPSKSPSEPEQPRLDSRQGHVQDAERRSGSAEQTSVPAAEVSTQPRLVTGGQLASTVPVPPVALSRPEPFGVSSVPIDGTVHGLLHYYVHYYYPTMWPNEMVVLKLGLYTFQASVQYILRMAITSPLAMYCLLSAATCRMQHIDRFSDELVTARESFYMSKATGLMAAHIQHGQLEGNLRQNLICIMFLLSAESYRDNISAATIHMRAVQRIVAPIGGLSALQDEGLQNQLAMGDLFLACVRMKPCVFEPFYDPGPPSVLELQASDLLNPPERLSKIAARLQVAADVASSGLIVLIQQLAESYSIKCRINATALPAKRVLRITRWVTTRNMAIRNWLLGLTLPTRTAEAVRMAVIMWSLLVMNITGRTKTVKIMAPMLLLLLDEINTEDWGESLAIRLWILMVGYQCAAKASECSESFAIEVRDQGNRLFPLIGPSIGKVEREKLLSKHLEDFQTSFFYDEEVQRPRTMALTRRILEIT